MTGSVVSGDELTRVLASINSIVAALQPHKQPPAFDALPREVAALPENDALLVRYRHGELDAEQARKLMALAVHYADLEVMKHLTDTCGVTGPLPLHWLQVAIARSSPAGVDGIRTAIQFVNAHGGFTSEPDEVVAVMWAAAGVSEDMATMVADELPGGTGGSLEPYRGVLGDDFHRKLRMLRALGHKDVDAMIEHL